MNNMNNKALRKFLGFKALALKKPEKDENMLEDDKFYEYLPNVPEYLYEDERKENVNVKEGQ